MFCAAREMKGIILATRLFSLLFLCSTCFGVSPSIESFNSGQVSPHLELRTDYEKYASSNRLVENMLLTVQGPAQRRPGTQYIAETEGISADYVTGLFIGRYESNHQNYTTVTKLTTEGVIDTTWATSGFWQSTTGWSGCSTIRLLAGGAMYVAHDDVDYGDEVLMAYFDNADEDNPVQNGEVIDNGSGVTANIDQTIYMRERSASAARLGFLIITDMAGGTFANLDTGTGQTSNNTVRFRVGAGGPSQYKQITKLDADGVVDTAWAVEGHLGFQEETDQYVSEILVDSSGNLYVIQTAGAGSPHLFKTDSTGRFVWAKVSSATPGYREYFMGYNGAVLSSDETKLYLCGYGATLGAIGFHSNIMCVNTSDGTVDSSWGKKLDGTSGSGYVECNEASEGRAMSMKADSSGDLYIEHYDQTYDTVKYSLVKLTASTGARDATWGTDGRAGIGRHPMISHKRGYNVGIDLDDDDVLYTICHPMTNGSFTVGTVHVDKYDTSGNRTTIKTVSGVGNYPIISMVENDGIVYLGGQKLTIDSVSSTIHSYDTDGNYISGFPDSGLDDVDDEHVVIIAPLDVVQSYSGDGVSVSSARLIPFEYSTDDSYVLALSDSAMGFFRTIE